MFRPEETDIDGIENVQITDLYLIYMLSFRNHLFAQLGSIPPIEIRDRGGKVTPSPSSHYFN